MNKYDAHSLVYRKIQGNKEDKDDMFGDEGIERYISIIEDDKHKFCTGFKDEECLCMKSHYATFLLKHDIFDYEGTGR